MTNEELAKAARQGNQGALPQLWEATRALLFAFAWKFYTRQGKDRCAQRGVALETEREAADRLTGAQQDLEDALGQQLELLLQAWPQQGDLSPPTACRWACPSCGTLSRKSNKTPGPVSRPF